MKTTIYGLVDPRNGHLRYIGKTSGALKTRLAEHVREPNREKVRRRGLNHRQKWCALLSRAGLTPEIFEIENVDGDGCEAEIFFIAYFKSLGCNLTNLTSGGEGVPGRALSAAHRKKLSLALRGRVVSQSSREAIARSNSARVWSAESREKGAAKKRGRKISQAHKEKISKALKGRKLSEAHKEKIRAASKGRVFTDEHRRKAIAARWPNSGK